RRSDDPLEGDCDIRPAPGQQSWRSAPTSQGWSVIMNPQSPLRIRTIDRGEGFAEAGLDQCRSLLVRPGTRAEILAAHPDDRVLVTSERSPSDDRRCIGLGATKLEVGLLRDGSTPPIVWRKGEMPAGRTNLDALTDAIVTTTRKLVDSLQFPSGPSR